MNSKPARWIRGILIGISINAIFVGGAQAGLHYLGPVNPYASVWIWAPPVQALVPGIDTFWVFSSNSSGTTTDPNRPPAILGGSGPWSFTETNIDPFGNTRSTGIQYELGVGGVGLESSVNPLFVFPTTPAGINGGVAFLYWIDPVSGGIQTFSEDVIDVTLPIPSSITDPLEVYQYIYDNARIPEPNTLLLLSIGFAVLFLFSRRIHRQSALNWA